MNRVRAGLTALVVCVLSAAAAYDVVSGTVQTPAPNPGYSSFTVGGGGGDGRTFAITRTATDQAALEHGLMGSKVTNQTVMLFIFPRADYWSFWMYDTNTSLSIIWVDSHGEVGRVVGVVNSAPSCFVLLVCAHYQPGSPANLVIEAKGGFAAANGVAIGTTISFSSAGGE